MPANPRAPAAVSRVLQSTMPDAHPGQQAPGRRTQDHAQGNPQRRPDEQRREEAQAHDPIAVPDAADPPVAPALVRDSVARNEPGPRPVPEEGDDQGARDRAKGRHDPRRNGMETEREAGRDGGPQLDGAEPEYRQDLGKDLHGADERTGRLRVRRISDPSRDRAVRRWSGGRVS